MTVYVVSMTIAPGNMMSLVGVFSTRGHAEAFINRSSRAHLMSVHTFQVDEPLSRRSG